MVKKDATRENGTTNKNYKLFKLILEAPKTWICFVLYINIYDLSIGNNSSKIIIFKLDVSIATLSNNCC